MKKVLLIAPLISGHRSTYLRLIIEHARSDGWWVILATRKGANETYQQEQSSPNSWPHEYVDIKSPRLSTLAKITRRYRPTVTIVPDGDRVVAELGIRRRWQGFGTLSLLVMRPPKAAVTSSIGRAARRHVKLRLTERATTVPAIRVHELSSALTQATGRAGIVTDPIEYNPSRLGTGEIKRKLGIEDDRFWFAILGAITERKCVPELVAAIDGSISLEQEASQRQVALLLAGKLSEGVKEYIRELPDALQAHIKVVDQRLSDEELDDAIRAVDCVVIAHRNEGPSGIMGKAAVAGARVLAAGARSLEADCASVQRGRIWAPLDVNELAKAVIRVQSEPKPDPVRVLELSEFWRVLSAQE